MTTFDDFGNGKAAIRGVAIRHEFQGQGHGRELLRALEAFAKSRGISELCVNADAQKTGYYAASGFSEASWSEDELADCRAGRAWPMPVQMHKKLLGGP